MSMTNAEQANELAMKIVNAWKQDAAGLTYTLGIAKLTDRIAMEVEIAFDLRDGGKRPPSRPTCAMCGQPIVKNGNFWEHVDSNPRHPARPAKMPGQKEIHL